MESRVTPGQIKSLNITLHIKKFDSEPKGQMKEYFQIIHRLYPKIGMLQTSRDFKYLGIYTSYKKPSASGTWFLLHYLSVKEIF